MLVIKPKPGQLVVRAYCTKCGRLLMESNRLTKKQLINLWDRIVIGAVGIKCKDCNTKFPNFDLDLRVYDTKFKREYAPTDYIKLPKGKRETPEELFKAVSKRWLSEHPGMEEVTQEDVVAALNQQREEAEGISLTKEERLERAINLRNKYNKNGKGHE